MPTSRLDAAITVATARASTRVLASLRVGVVTVLGVIAEGDSDVAVVGVLARNIAQAEFEIRSAVGKGCGRMQKKALGWARELHRRGCTHLMLVCDLDENSRSDLAARLTKALEGFPIERRVVVIPVRQIEAWLLADQDAVSDAFKLHRRVKHQANPEGIRDPKQRLGELLAERSGKRVQYLNSVHNPLIAQHARVDQLRRCPSFTGFEAFVREHLG
jgi:hypothetical protein